MASFKGFAGLGRQPIHRLDEYAGKCDAFVEINARQMERLYYWYAAIRLAKTVPGDTYANTLEKVLPSAARKTTPVEWRPYLSTLLQYTVTGTAFGLASAVAVDCLTSTAAPGPQLHPFAQSRSLDDVVSWIEPAHFVDAPDITPYQLDPATSMWSAEQFLKGQSGRYNEGVPVTYHPYEDSTATWKGNSGDTITGFANVAKFHAAAFRAAASKLILPFDLTVIANIGVTHFNELAMAAYTNLAASHQDDRDAAHLRIFQAAMVFGGLGLALGLRAARNLPRSLDYVPSVLQNGLQMLSMTIECIPFPVLSLYSHDICGKYMRDAETTAHGNGFLKQLRAVMWKIIVILLGDHQTICVNELARLDTGNNTEFKNAAVMKQTAASTSMFCTRLVQTRDAVLLHETTPVCNRAVFLMAGMQMAMRSACIQKTTLFGAGPYHISLATLDTLDALAYTLCNQVLFACDSASATITLILRSQYWKEDGGLRSILAKCFAAYDARQRVQPVSIVHLLNTVYNENIQLSKRFWHSKTTYKMLLTGLQDRIPAEAMPFPAFTCKYPADTGMYLTLQTMHMIIKAQ